MTDIVKDAIAAMEARDESACQVAVEYVATYVELQRQIGELEAVADEAKAAALELLQAEGAPVGKVWAFPGLATVTVVKGRRSEKLDRGRLARAGVSAEVLDAATIVTEGTPSVRIAADRGEQS